ncbi:leucine-rich repeat domain-containing protein [Poritiphilus flavus]|uniref:PKD domain-containing protein n=1 Tax=Poritiphilus flavus TaxID=2697053 RepID=A0A6L9EFA0_9FLAO|nr:hypothetical protein [Poritiphilus flavus]NAS13333.1 hypothetical protein [Poritiphilus flavus]
MRSLYFLLFLSIVIASCSSESDPEVVPGENESMETEGKQVFRIDFKEITSSGATLKSSGNLEPAFALISISDNSGNPVYTREKFALTKVEENYETEEITLDAGTYSLTEFIVTDANDVVISLAPIGDSALSEFTETFLPLEFLVEEDETAVSTTENIEADGFTAFDFGYGEVNLDFPESTDFFSLTVNDTQLLTAKTIAIKSVTGSRYAVDWGDGSIEDYQSANSNNPADETEISHTYAAEGEYTVNISGPLEVIEYLKFASNDQQNNFQTNLVSIQLDKLVLLKVLTLYSGQLTTLDISENIALEKLELGFNQINSLDLSNNATLEQAFLRYNQLTALDVSQNINLKFLDVTGNQFSSLDVAANTLLEKLLARENQLTALNISSNTALNTLDLSDNFLPSIDTSGNMSLVEINVGRNQLTSIDFSANTNLRRIDLYGNQISALDVSNNLVLRDLYIEDNLLSTIDLSNNPEMERLIIENNAFSTLDLTNNAKIFDLQIGGNQFDGAQLDTIIAQVHEQAVLNTILDGYIDYQNNPGFNAIDPSTTTKINDLINNYNWFFNNN